MDEVVADLAARWRKARRAALRPLAAGAPGGAALDDVPDDDLASAALVRDPDEALRRVFDVSLRLGEGFRRYHGLDLPLADLVRVLPRLGAPCAAGPWQAVAGEAAYRTRRAACDTASRHPRACALWREAIEGLILGATGAVRHARHASAGAGDPACVDVVYVDPQSPLRFGPIEPDVRAGLESVRRTARALDGAVEVEFLGVSEGVVYYRAWRPGDDAGAVRVTTMIEHGIRRRFPHLAAREVTSRPVLAAGG